MRFTLPLTFHKERTQPLSDIIDDKADVFLTSKTPVEVNVSVMTSRGLAFIEKTTISDIPFKVPYEPPWGRDWSVLQLTNLKQLSEMQEPVEILLTIEAL
jgi:hypothetical protein